jgi:hypothetical protein
MSVVEHTESIFDPKRDMSRLSDDSLNESFLKKGELDNVKDANCNPPNISKSFSLIEPHRQQVQSRVHEG